MARRRNANLTNFYPYTRCKVLRHAFEPVGPIPGPRPRVSFGVLVTFRCEHCDGIRFDVVSRLTGDLLWRTYAMAEDYKTPHQTMAEWRVEYLDQMDNNLLLNLDES
jgi:hypothetical protein